MPLYLWEVPGEIRLSQLENETGDLSAITGVTSGLGECQVKPQCPAYKPIVHPTPAEPPLPAF